MSLSLEEAYARVIADSLFAFVWRDGEILPVYKDQSPFKTGFIHLFPGSFNPMHAAHLALYESITAREKYFELAIERIDKEFLSLDSLRPRLEQTNGIGSILVNRWPYFMQKAGVLCHWSITFHIGIDNAVKLLQHHGVAGIQGINGKFIVYDREVSGECLGLHNHREFDGRLPMNCLRGETPDPALMGLSSTQIRQQHGITDMKDLPQDANT